ncbi:MAG: T9SS type A sorting domain-containing protein, partial [Ignavibacteriaceae bacterium]|nr:T9SS type A sorting domain-containing protein [Ignavibacteriaceae bacterium]
TTGGASWDTAGYLNAFSLSPFNDQVLFSTENGILNKTTDGGLNKQVVDTISANGYRTDFLFYDKDSNYIYRTGFYYNQGSVYKFLVSDKSGDAYSWQEKYSSPLPLYVSVDYTIAGSVYLAAGKIIYSSTDFGYTFSPLRTLDRNITGIYKKPGFSKLYASTDNAIYEIDGSAISIIKQIPIDKEIFRFDPLDIGNKWVYHISSPTLYNLDKEVVKDTLLANNKLFKQIRMIYSDSLSKNISFTYERIDSLTGDVYSWGADSTEYIIDNLNHNPGDTIFASRYFRTGSTFFDSLKTVSLLGKQFETRVYSTGDPFIGYDYYLSKNMGVSHIRHNAEVALIITTLKGAVIKGIVYGDTSTVVGITDKNPVRLNKFTLSQNYPNPFNPSTKIRYSIAYRGNVTLKIYDIIGKEISVLVNSIKEPGNYEINFNASGFASGIYFYELRSAGNMLTKKMILIK